MNSATLEATMRLEISQLQSSLAKADASVAKFKANCKKEGSGLGNALFGGLKGGLGAMLPAMGITALAAGFKAATDSMDDLADTALRLGESTEMIQRVTHASEILAGVDAEGLTKSFLRLEKSLGDLDNEGATKALADLGITAESLAAAPLDEKILMMAEAFQKARATGTGYNDILDLLGKSAGDLIPMFMQTREAITGMFDDAHIVPDEEVQRLAALNDQIDGYINNLKGWAVEAVALSVRAVDALSLSNADRAAASAAKDTPAKAKPTPRDGVEAQAAAAAAQKESEKLAKLEEAQNKRIGDKSIEVEKLKREAAEERLPIEGKIAALQERLAAAKELEAKAAVYDDVELQLDAEKERLTLQREIARLMVEQSAASRDAAEECERITKAARDEAIEVAKSNAERRKQVAQNQANRENVLMDLEVLRLRARGNDKGADKIEREARIEAEKNRLMKEENASEEYALKLAQERARLEDKLENRRSGKPGHIGGVTNRRYMKDASGLDEFRVNQMKRPLRPGEKPPPGYQAGDMVPITPDPLSGRGPRRGRMMGEDGGSLSDRAARAAGAQDAREKSDTTSKDLLTKINDTLERGLLG